MAFQCGYGWHNKRRENRVWEDGSEIFKGEERVGKLKNGMDAGKDEFTGEMTKGGGDKVVDWLLKLCNMAFDSGVVPEDWKSAGILPL